MQYNGILANNLGHHLFLKGEEELDMIDTAHWMAVELYPKHRARAARKSFIRHVAKTYMRWKEISPEQFGRLDYEKNPKKTPPYMEKWLTDIKSGVY